MKKPIMSVSRARKWLKAVVSLREYYEGKNLLWKYGCPFCSLADHPDGWSKECCHKCLWVLFDDTTCPRGVTDRRYEREVDWVAASIPRLKRWERKLNRIIGAGK